MVASGQAVVDGIKAFRAAGSNAQIVTLSNNASGGFIKSLGDNARGVIVTQVFPNERSIAYAMVKEAQELARAKKLTEISPAMLEGYAAAKVLVETGAPVPSRRARRSGSAEHPQVRPGWPGSDVHRRRPHGLTADPSIIGRRQVQR
jgi:ABC-type branched-subunit amino acid transport system substrate-binding protein